MKKVLAVLIGMSTLFSGNNCSGSIQEEKEHEKPRTIVTTDGEVDDMDTFIRLLLYMNEFNVEGLVYTSSQWHYAGDGKGTLFTSEMSSTARRYGERTDLRWAGTEWIQKLIDKYGAVYSNLVKHDKGYPSPEYLKSIVKIGNIDFEGEMARNTEGSDFIKKILLDNEPGPVYVQIWGGTNTLARALKSIKEDYRNTSSWQEIYKKVSEKTIIYAVLDQDATYTKYISPNWPDIRVIYNSAQFWSFAYMWPRVVPDTIKPFLSGDWFAENIKFNHGPLLENYYTWGDGQKIEGDPEHTQGDLQEAKKQQQTQYSFISEGDSPAYFFMLNYGLRSMEDPSFGGLGGRFVKSASNPNRWEDGAGVTDFDPFTGKAETSYPQVRWIEDLQNDFAARANWCVKDYSEANHAPVVQLNHAHKISVKPGANLKLSATATDPDGNILSYSWWQYKEAGTFNRAVTISGANEKEASIIIPTDAEKGKTIHLILEVTDNGIPVLTRYQRVVVTIG
jgi:hypothetical protein